MKIEAAARLRQSEVEAVTYAQYAKVIASLDPSSQEAREVLAWGFSLPGPLKKLWGEMKEVGTLLKDSAGIGMDAIVQAFKEKSVFKLLKGLGFSVVKLFQAVQKALALPASAFFAALDEIVEVFGSSKIMQNMKVKERLAKLDAITKKHPVLTKVTGIALAGFLIWSFLHASFVGDITSDLELIDSVLYCLRGKYDLVDIFASKEGIHALSILVFGLATGGASLMSYGVGTVEKGLHFLGAHAGNAASILLALFYAAAKKLHLHVSTKLAPKALGAAFLRLKASRTQSWWHKLDSETKEAYKKKFPGTKFVHKTSLVLPS